MILEVRLLGILYPVSTDRLYCPQQAFRSGKKEIVAAVTALFSTQLIRSGQDLHGSGSHLLVDAETQVFMRVHRGIEDAYFIVQVRTGAASALTHVADGITPANQLSRAYRKP
jgi:hypothetical protein